MDNILERVNLVEKQIAQVKSKVAHRDLRRRLGAVDHAISLMSQESVECRRLKKSTIRYRELTEETNKLLDNLEQHITFAALLG